MVIFSLQLTRSHLRQQRVFTAYQIDRSLNADTFNSLTNLHTLKLDTNQLTRIESATFSRLTSLALSSFEQKHVVDLIYV